MTEVCAIRFEPVTRPEICPKCGADMYVTRRSPHPFIVLGEKQVLTCDGCKAQTMRSITDDGNTII